MSMMESGLDPYRDPDHRAADDGPEDLCDDYTQPTKFRSPAWTSSTSHSPVTVKGSAVAKTDQYDGDRQRLVGDNTTAGRMDMGKGTRGNSKQMKGLGSTSGQVPGGGKAAPTRKPYESRSAHAQGPGMHPAPRATMAGAGVRKKAPK